ncbi:MAG TPA: ankyrin repeat domain-containing protein [Gemmatimonadales bacterium]|nr:ankyrin repeat domain-containing protein [Gemmatimonadales bacterium]
MAEIGDLLDAVRAGDAGRVQAILGASPALINQRNERGHSPVLIAQYHHKHAVVRVLLDAGPDLDIFDAASVGQADRIAEILDANPELVNAYSSDGFYPLGLAAFFAQPDAVALLLARGADVAQVARNPMRIQPLHAAAAGRSMAVVRMLVEAGAPVNAKQQGGWAPLHEAVNRNDAELARYLLDHAADPRLQNDAGASPIGIAAEKGFLELLKLLKR